jgi:hypothetical protein
MFSHGGGGPIQTCDHSYLLMSTAFAELSLQLSEMVAVLLAARAHH